MATDEKDEKKNWKNGWNTSLFSQRFPFFYVHSASQFSFFIQQSTHSLLYGLSKSQTCISQVE